MRKKFIIVLLPLFLSGCLTITPYQSVKTGPRAKITLISPEPRMTFNIGKASGDCNREYLGFVRVDYDDTEKSFYVQAGKRMNVAIYIDYPAGFLRSYGMIFKQISFILQENKNYKIEWVDLGEYQGDIRYNLLYKEYDESGQEHDWEIEYWPTCPEKHTD